MTTLRATPLAERGLVAALAGLILTAAAAPSVTVSRQGDRLDVAAQAMPLSEVIDAVAEKLGVPVEYEGAPPGIPVTLTLRDRTPAEAILSLLDGTGVDFALQFDASGQGVVRLLVHTSKEAGAARASRSPGPTPGRRPTRPTLTPPPVPEFPQPFDPALDPDEESDLEDDDETAGPAPSALTAPTPRPGRPVAAPLLFPGPLVPAAPTPTPPPQQD